MRLAIIALVVLAAAIGGLVYWLHARHFASTDNAYVNAHTTEIAGQVSGPVTKVYVRENQAVKKGDVLFRIDPEPLEINVAKAQASLDSVHSLLGAARAGFRSAEATMSSSPQRPFPRRRRWPASSSRPATTARCGACRACC